MSFRGNVAKLSWVLGAYQSRTKLTEIFEYDLPYSLLGKIIDKLMFRMYIGKMMERELKNLTSLLEKE